MNKMNPKPNTLQELTDFFNCPNCGETLSQIWENNGFVPPNGPEKMEFSHYSCKSCGNNCSHDDLKEQFLLDKKQLAQNVS